MRVISAFPLPFICSNFPTLHTTAIPPPPPLKFQGTATNTALPTFFVPNCLFQTILRHSLHVYYHEGPSPNFANILPQILFSKNRRRLSFSLLRSTMQIRYVFVVDKRGSHFSREDNRGTSDQKKMFSTIFFGRRG